MSKRRKKPRGPRGPSTRYDTEMIRDFLEHLVWEVRAVLQEQSMKPETVHDEVVEQLAKYTKKYKAALLPATYLDKMGVTEAESRDVVNKLRDVNKQTYGEWLNHLEKLEGLFEVALRAADWDLEKKGLPVRKLRAADAFEADDKPATPDEFPGPTVHVSQLQDEEVRAALAEVDVILAVSPTRQKAVFGRSVLEQIIASEAPSEVTVLGVIIDEESDLETLLTAVTEIKGYHEYTGGGDDE